MKRKFIVTVTDTGTFRQYTLSQLAKWFAWSVLALVISVAAVTFWYVSWLNDAYGEAQERAGKFREESIVLESQIAQKQGELELLGDRLVALEEYVGVRPEDHFTFDKRVENVTLSSAQLKILFTQVPNGAPVPFKRITSSYGWRTHPITKTREFHSGIDLHAPTNTPVWTPADGVVEYAGFHKKSGFGNLIIIDHGFGFKTYYGHLHKVSVKRGDALIKGDIIGKAGNTGMSTAAHLHYEIRFLTYTLNPIYFIRWQQNSYRSIFNKVKRVPWDSIIALTSHAASRVLQASSPRAQP